MTFYQIIIFYGATLTCLQVIWPWISIQKINFLQLNMKGHMAVALSLPYVFVGVGHEIWFSDTFEMSQQKIIFQKSSSSWLLVVTRTYLLYDFRSESYLRKSDGGRKNREIFRQLFSSWVNKQNATPLRKWPIFSDPLSNATTAFFLIRLP